MLVAGIAVVGVVLYLVLKPNQTVSLPNVGGGAPAQVTDPGWQFAAGIEQSVAGIVTNITNRIH